MKQFFGMNQRGDLAAAVQGLHRPEFIMLLSNDAQFEAHVKELEKRFPGVPSIGCIGMSYQTGIVENGVGVIAFTDGVSAAANVLEQVSTMPVKFIRRLEKDIQQVGGGSRNTVCIDFCTGNDACVLTTMYTVLQQRGISLVGGTGGEGRVSANGRVYQDAVVYGVVRNLNGRVKTYKENIYHQLGDYRFIASNTDRANYILGALNGKPAKQVYKSILHVTDEEILTRTFQNPFGKVNGDDTCIISIKEASSIRRWNLGYASFMDPSPDSSTRSSKKEQMCKGRAALRLSRTWSARTAAGKSLLIISQHPTSSSRIWTGRGSSRIRAAAISAPPKRKRERMRRVSYV